MHLIGINGFKRSGKGTVANFVQDHYTGGEGVVYQVGFADKVKMLGARALGFLDETPRESIALMDEAKEHWFIDAHTIGCSLNCISGRKYLQNVGVQARDLFGADFWVDQVLPDPVRSYGGSDAPVGEPSRLNQLFLEESFPGVDCVAITDLRFENEAQRVLDLGGVVWRVNRPDTESDGHASEQPLPDELVTLEIHNDGTLGQLETRVQDALETLS